MLGLAAAAAIGLAGPARADEEKVLNVYNWSDYIGENTVKTFEQQTGIKVNYDVYDSNETLETKLLTGHTGYDVVVPSGGFLGKQIQAGVFGLLDKAKLTNLKNMDESIMKAAAQFDPDNAHSVPYFWGTVGIGYNVKKINEHGRRAGQQPRHDLQAGDRQEIRRLRHRHAGCARRHPRDRPALYGPQPLYGQEGGLQAAQDMLLKVRPYIKYFHSSRYIDDMANGEICLALGWNGDFLIAGDRATEAKNGVEVQYRIPKEGTQLWIDNLAIPADAPHPNNALLFINFLMEPQIAADGANFVNYATPNKAALPLIKPELRNNPDVYPPPDVMAKLFPDKVATPAVDRLRTRTWTRIKTGS
jgi:Spermidine/putrescine-binding periplasmic protein